MSLHSDPRRVAQRRRSKDDQQERATVSPWHLLGLGLVALLGTGILAAVDRSQERAAAQTTVRPGVPKADLPITRTTAAVAGPAIEGAPRPLADAHPPAPPAPPPVASPAVQPRPDNRALFFASVPIARTEASPAAAPAVLAPEPVAAQPSQVLEGPVATASLAPPAPPTRPAPTEPPAVAPGSLKASAAAPTECLPNELRAVLADLASRFGTIAVVSTHQLTTGNHSAGSIREGLHHACKAVDIRPDRNRIDEIKTYLRSRREIVGVESYRNGVIHFDVSGGRIARNRARTRAGAAATAPADAMQAPPAPQTAEAPSLFTPVVPERYR